MSRRYVTNTDGQGWLTVVHEDGRQSPALPQGLEVMVERESEDREYFRIVEGIHRGRRASVKLPPTSGGCSFRPSYLMRAAPRRPPALLRLDAKTNTLWYAGGRSAEVAFPIGNPIPEGTWDIEIPDEVHSRSGGYLAQSRYATTWFRIGHDGDRFLHPGSVTAGCATVTDVDLWTEIYDYLIFARAGDLLSVGRMEVTH